METLSIVCVKKRGAFNLEKVQLHLNSMGSIPLWQRIVARKS